MPSHLEPIQTLTIATLLDDWLEKRRMDDKVAELADDAAGRYLACSRLLDVDFDRRPHGPPAGRPPDWITTTEADAWFERDSPRGLDWARRAPAIPSLYLRLHTLASGLEGLDHGSLPVALEGRPAPEVGLFDGRHRDVCGPLREALARQHLVELEEIAAWIYGTPAITATAAELVAAGHPDGHPPDPDEFW